MQLVCGSSHVPHPSVFPALADGQPYDVHIRPFPEEHQRKHRVASATVAQDLYSRSRLDAGIGSGAFGRIIFGSNAPGNGFDNMADLLKCVIAVAVDTAVMVLVGHAFAAAIGVGHYKPNAIGLQYFKHVATPYNGRGRALMDS